MNNINLDLIRQALKKSFSTVSDMIVTGAIRIDILNRLISIECDGGKQRKVVDLNDLANYLEENKDTLSEEERQQTFSEMEKTLTEGVDLTEEQKAGISVLVAHFYASYCDTKK